MTVGPVALSVWTHHRRRWGWIDILALLAWTAAVVVVFRDAALFRGALFYFDVTEINLPYREFLFRELKAGRFSRWCPDLYCGMPLYSESQAGYFHPLKYFLYPFLPTWKAFNLDTIVSVWLAGAGTYGWLRRHVGAVGALTGAAIFALGGYTWAHLVHTSMTNALASVPLAVWALESSWDRGRLRALVVGSLAIACQVFAGHLQDTILTGSALGIYGVYRAATERTGRARLYVLATTAGLVLLGGLISAVQWIPSKELLDRSPRAGGLTWDTLTYGSWHPQLLPTLVVRESYGTRARDDDWMDGFFPYHEMDAYLGIVGLLLAAIGARAYRDRWVGFWVILAAIGSVLMLGRYTFLLDFLHRVPIVGSSRIPVRFHLWVTLAVAALAAVGADRLARPGTVKLRGVVLFLGALLLVSIPILWWTYAPIWAYPARWNQADHRQKFGWLSTDLIVGTARTLSLLLGAIIAANLAARSANPRRKVFWAATLPLLIVADLAGAHLNDIPTVDPAYWTEPPASVVALRADPTRIRIYGEATYSSAEPGYASKSIDFLAVRESLGWSLPTHWGLASIGGETPIIPRRRLRFTDWQTRYRYDLDGMSHVLSTTPSAERLGPYETVGHAFLHKNPKALPRARFMGNPVYAEDEVSASKALRAMGEMSLKRVVVEDPDRPLAENAGAEGTTRIEVDEPETVRVAVDAATSGYLLLADTFDPGWSATVEGQPVPIRPANVAFRAVFLQKGKQTVVFRYEPARFRVGLGVSIAGFLVCLVLLIRRSPTLELEPEHKALGWPAWWPWIMMLMIASIIAGSIVAIRPGGGIGVQDRWKGSFHPFTWGAKTEAIRPPPPRLE